jgi:leader peptidase (prepilin peptidase)/N-methyltransferase
VAYSYGLSIEWLVYLLLGTMLIAASFIDFEIGLLPDRITIGGTVLAFGASFILADGPHWQDAVLGALVGGGFLWVLHYGYQLWRKDIGIGLGDVKLTCMIGALTGINGVVFTFIVGGLAGYIGVGITLLRSKDQGEDKLFPYGPFLSLGCMIYILYGEPLLRWWATF